MPASEKKKLDANCTACNDRAMTGAPHRVQSHRDKCDIAGHRRPHKDLPTAHAPSDLEKKSACSKEGLKACAPNRS